MDGSEVQESLLKVEEETDSSDIDELRSPQTGKVRREDDVRMPLTRVWNDGEQNSRSAAQRRRSEWQTWFISSRVRCMLVLSLLTAVLLIALATWLWVRRSGDEGSRQSEPWYPAPAGGSVASWAESYRKAADLVSQMTLVEKVNITTGSGWSMGPCVGNTASVDRLGFPSLCLQDGPLGIRFVGDSTAFPAGVTVGATWNKELMYERGKAHGYEARLKGIHVLLGPSMGPIGRLPAGGRNWEGFGADPVLQGIAAAQTIRGIQDSGVIATAKHYVGNEQEHYRQAWEWGLPNALSSNIDDRTMHEIYAWPFAESVRAGVASVMCSYNQVNNSYACQNSKLLNAILKDELGFQGFIQSDWLAQRSGVASALAGLDMTMPGDGLFWADGKSLWGSRLTQAVLNGSIPMDRLNDMVLRVVSAWYQLRQDDESKWPKISNGGGPNFSSWTSNETGLLYPGSPGSKEADIVNKYIPVRNTTEGGDHDALARRIAREGIVLVKNNDEILPLSRNAARINKGRGRKVKVGIFGEDAYLAEGGANACKDRGCNKGTLTMGWGSGAVELPYLVTPAEALHANFDNETVEVTDWKQNDHAGAVAAQQDLCLVFISSDAGEGFISWNGIRGDRNNLDVQKQGDKLVKSVADHCGKKSDHPGGANTIVILHTVGPTLVEKWIDHPTIKAVVIAHLPGQESGNAIADILFGDVSPSGHLPYTIARAESDYGPTSKILRVPNGIVPQQDFSEGLYIDYRYFDQQKISPRFEFGFGLSYSNFSLSSLAVTTMSLKPGEPAARPPPSATPPRLDNKIPDSSSALWPSGQRRLKKFIYPYIDKVSDVRKGDYRYPIGYDAASHLQSPAGGAEGGNPALYETAAEVQVLVANLGPVTADCVVQLYIEYPSGVRDGDGKPVDMPVRVLRGFEKVTLGTSDDEKEQNIALNVTRKDLSYWDVKKQDWIMPAGDFTAAVGFSSRNLPTRATFMIGR